MDDISKRYNKDVIVVEAAYAYTLETAITRKIVSRRKKKRTGVIRPPYRGNIIYSRFNAGRHRCS
jgi:arabinogalactan endo-1,4-beta-galactosidase